MIPMLPGGHVPYGAASGPQTAEQIQASYIPPSAGGLIAPALATASMVANPKVDASPLATKSGAAHPAAQTDPNAPTIAGSPYQAGETDNLSAFRYLAAWAVALVLLALINRSHLGHAIIYYLLVLALATLVLTESLRINELLLPLEGPQDRQHQPFPPDPGPGQAPANQANQIQGAGNTTGARFQQFGGGQ